MRGWLGLLVAVGVALGAAGPARAQDRPKVLVLDLVAGAEVPPDYARTLTEMLSYRLGKSRAFEVIAGEDLRRLVELEGERTAMGCDLDESCLADIAGALGARFVVYGRLSKLGSLLVLNLSWLDSQGGVALGRVNYQAQTVEEIAQVMLILAGDLVTRAVNKLDSARPPDPEGARFLLTANQHLENAEYDEAARLLLELVGRPSLNRPQRLDVLRLLGHAEFMLENRGEARLHYESILWNDPDYSLPASEPPRIQSYFNSVREHVERQRRLEENQDLVEQHLHQQSQSLLALSRGDVAPAVQTPGAPVAAAPPLPAERRDGQTSPREDRAPRAPGPAAEEPSTVLPWTLVGAGAFLGVTAVLLAATATGVDLVLVTVLPRLGPEDFAAPVAYGIAAVGVAAALGLLVGGWMTFPAEHPEEGEPGEEEP